ncbi:uncharacterized protein LOC111872233 [Cryptotermes secundus]|uniref:uncharacterized protein LOC111872233 n=1 Tax=Cryptotermes secundus TaxID=105785 RepID=UPI000CD7AB5F|nr:uncharacterized protein LOC111872233 [Cryptotermes secundus]
MEGKKMCSAPGCLSSSGQKETKFFNFPRDSARALVWAGRVGISCTIDSARMLHNKYLCSRHFLESDFTTAERVHLNSEAVPCGSDSAAQSLRQPPEPSLHIPSFDPLPLVSSPEDDLHGLPPTITYSKILVPSTVTPVPIHADSPSTSFQMSAVQPSPTAANTFAVKETSFPPSSVNVSASDGELGHVSRQSSSSKPRAKHSLLKLNLASHSELTPRKRKLYELIRNNESALCRLKKKYKGMDLEELCEVVNDPLMKNLSSSFSLEAATFLAAMFRNCRQMPKGKRWTFDDKVLALSLLKRFPKSYILLRTLFPLPSRGSLLSMLNTVPFRTGINAHVFHALQQSLQKMSDGNHYCCLMFDEMSIRENLHFNQKFDCIEGFEDCGSWGRTCNIANHALVFMIRGLRREWKQPVAYYFTRGSTKAEVIVQCLEEVLDACQNIGLKVVTTVCDMGANNVKALKLLGATKRKPLFRFHNQEIATVYDPSHLLKSTRNLFLKHDVQFKSELLDSQLPLIAKWDHILKLYEFDRSIPIRRLIKFTDANLNPTGQSAMKVQLAAHVMSHTVAAGLNALVDTGYFGSEYMATAVFVKEVDNLIDSFNSGMRVRPEKTLRYPLSDKSPHIKHWKKASMGIKSWIFLKDGKPAFLHPPPSQNGWLVDITAAQHVWRTLKKAGFEYFHTKNLNQDPLENTFGAIRSCCGSNNDPTVGQFVDALKTSIISGFDVVGVCESNCEDDGAALLDNLQSFLREPDAASQKPSTSHGKETSDDVPESFHVAQQLHKDIGATVDAGNMKVFSVAYVSGSIARQVLHGVSCDACKTCLTSEVLPSASVFIHFKECSDTEQSLTCPSEKLVETVGVAVTLMESMMAEVAHLNSVEQHITAAIMKSIDFEWIRCTGCSLHYQRIVDGIVRCLTRIYIPWWCKRANRLMTEAARQRATKRKMEILSHQ